jgi:hypothetical protein
VTEIKILLLDKLRGNMKKGLNTLRERQEPGR